eukprot:141004-Hanusia_phi.AAC.2
MHTNRQESKLKYVDEFLKLDCAPSLIALKLFPNAKEITESMAVYTAFRRLLSAQCMDFDSSDSFVFVGDGTTPRTAAIFAHLTRAGRCVAIDPMLKPSCQECFSPEDKSRDYKDFLTDPTSATESEEDGPDHGALPLLTEGGDPRGRASYQPVIFPFFMPNLGSSGLGEHRAHGEFVGERCPWCLVSERASGAGWSGDIAML